MSNNLHLFEGVGIEVEYMIVNSKTLDVQPICDDLLYAISGTYSPEVSCGNISYSNELALHVVELKTTGAAPTLSRLDEPFQEHVAKINERLARFNARLLPTAAHPWMDPFREMRLWEHEYNAIYESYHRIFDCRGHGWANLQSTHINLPFSGDDEFVRLHEAVRILLPILPALAASSPFLDGKKQSCLDARLDMYRFNQKAVASITGKVVPERVESIQDYYRRILEPMYNDIAPFDTERILQHEWLNSRGAIARFDRSTIEIRILDVQECPKADIAIAQACVFMLRRLVEQNGVFHLDVELLSRIFLDCVRDAEKAIIADQHYLDLFKVKGPITAGQLWMKLLEPLLMSTDPQYSSCKAPLELILRDGSLASRIVKSWKKIPTKTTLREVYQALSECLAEGCLYADRSVV